MNNKLILYHYVSLIFLFVLFFSSIDSLRYLAGLPEFTNLRLQDQQSGHSNPMCNTNYTDGVLMMLPMLNTLDGNFKGELYYFKLNERFTFHVCILRKQVVY